MECINFLIGSLEDTFSAGVNLLERYGFNIFCKEVSMKIMFCIIWSFLIGIVLSHFVDLGFAALPASSKLTWNAPTTTVDGQPINADTVLTGYTIYCGSSTGVYSITKPTGSTATEYKTMDIPLASGKWYCILTASNKYGESGYSNEYGFDLDNMAPGKVITLTWADMRKVV